jgi:glycolate oxidase FAD binding subunit
VRNEAEVVDAVRGAIDDEVPVEIVSGGGKREYGRPVSAERTLNVAALKGIIKYEPEELVLTAGAATPVEEIQAALAHRKQMLGFEPADWTPLFGGAPGRSTLAGTIAINACGARRVKAGAVRDHVIGCRFVNGWGEAVKAGGFVIKNVTGFDIPKLMCGAFGTLGVLTELTLRVVPLPPRVATCAVRCPSPEQGLRALRRAAALPVDATGLAYLPQAALTATETLRATPLAREAGVAFMRLEGAAEALDEKITILRGAFATADMLTLDDEMTARLFAEISTGAIFSGYGTDVWRLCVPSSAAHEALEESGASFWYADWAGGLLWLALDANDDSANRLRTITARVGGHATLLRADDEARARLDVFEPEAPARAKITRSVKAAFDPLRLFNPGRMYVDC